MWTVFFTPLSGSQWVDLGGGGAVDVYVSLGFLFFLFTFKMRIIFLFPGIHDHAETKSFGVIHLFSALASAVSSDFSF
jgi:hypothetical protein